MMSSQLPEAKRQKTSDTQDEQKETQPVVEFVYKGQPKINIPAGVSHVTTSPRVRKIKEEYFLCCKPLLDLKIGKSVQSIGRGAFEGCSYLCKVELPREGLTSIHIGAFRRCTSLVEMDLPQTLETIGRGAFEGCDSLKHLRCKGEGVLNYIGDRAFMHCHSLIDVALPQEVAYIGSEAFAYCGLLDALALPKTDRIRSEAFRGCFSLLGIEISAMDDDGDDFVIEHGAFAACRNLSNIWIPPSSATKDENVAADAFDACDKLQGENMVKRLCDRYSNLPVHKLCYHSSRTTVEELKKVLDAEKKDIKEGHNLEDCFGLTPFHIVAASANPRLDLFQCLLDYYPQKVLKHKNKSNQMMEYLLKNSSSAAVPIIKLVIQTQVLETLNTLRLGKSRKAELFRRFEAIQSNDDIETRCHRVDSFTKYSRYCVVMEATSLLELVLWKKKMQKEKEEVAENANDDDTTSFREDCRCQCGSDIVITNVFGYLCKSRSDLFAAEGYSITRVQLVEPGSQEEESEEYSA